MPGCHFASCDLPQYQSRLSMLHMPVQWGTVSEFIGLPSTTRCHVLYCCLSALLHPVEWATSLPHTQWHLCFHGTTRQMPLHAKRDSVLTCTCCRGSARPIGPSTWQNIPLPAPSFVHVALVLLPPPCGLQILGSGNNKRAATGKPNGAASCGLPGSVTPA